jgi:hypothetical protein
MGEKQARPISTAPSPKLDLNDYYPSNLAAAIGAAATTIVGSPHQFHH